MILLKHKYILNILNIQNVAKQLISITNIHIIIPINFVIEPVTAWYFKIILIPLHVILTSLTLYFLNNSLTRTISKFLKMKSNIQVSHFTIANWTNSFSPFFKNNAKNFKKSLNLQTDDWHTDETVIFYKWWKILSLVIHRFWN